MQRRGGRTPRSRMLPIRQHHRRPVPLLSVEEVELRARRQAVVRTFASWNRIDESVSGLSAV
jgi:hypothetical protein